MEHKPANPPRTFSDVGGEGRHVTSWQSFSAHRTQKDASFWMQNVILVVDDDESIRQSMAGHLEDLGFETIEAEDGRVALELFEESRPDLVLLDLRMPRVDGLEVLANLGARSPETPVIVVSGMGVMEDAVQALRLGAWDYLIKPIQDMTVLEHSVCKALERAQLIKENREYRRHLEGQVVRRTAELDAARQALEEKNLALREILANIQTDRRRVEESVISSVNKVILPMLQSLRRGLPGGEAQVVDQIEQSLSEITSPFVDKLSKDLASLTPTEIRICNLIRRGLTVKEIAGVENLAPDTVSTHRRNIRRKLGVVNKKVNLASYLETVFNMERQAAPDRRPR
jgi:DNA-binding NarL/FixJ family response regulator